MTHLPFRNWCRHCVAGRGKEAGHFRAADERRHDALPEVHLDYALPADEREIGVALLVAKERDTKMTMATVVSSKGPTGEPALRRPAAFLKEIGAERGRASR